MSGTFIPTPADLATFVEVADGDNENAASVTVFLEGLANAAAATARAPFNWLPKAATTNNLKRGTFAPKEQAWYGCGDGGNDFLEASYDGGRTWVNLAGSLGSLVPIVDVSARANGDILILASGARTIYKGTYASYKSVAFAVHTLAVSANVSDGTLDYDATNALWIATYRSGGAGMKLDTSPDALTFTARTLPATWTGYTGTAATPRVTSNATGKSVAWFYDDVALVYRVIYSSTATTWSDAGTLPPAVVASRISKPAYDSVNNTWWLAASRTAGSRVTDLFKSSNDGATWLNVGGLPVDCAIQDLVALNGVLIGINDDGRIFFSRDQGATWKFATCNTITSAASPGLRVGDGQCMVWNPADKTTYASLRHGGAGV